MCGEKGSGTRDHTQATCKKCMKLTNYDTAQYGVQCETPLVFCSYCENGQRALKVTRPTQLKIGCDKCDHTEWVDRKTFGG